MHQKPTDELVCVERYLFPTAAVTVIAPPKGDRITFQSENVVIGDGDSVGIASQILHNAGGILKWGFAVDNPLLVVAYLQESLVYLGKV